MAHGSPKLLSRDAFREAVFARDKNTCVFCPLPAVDAHHLIERRLWPDGGYYLDNGVAVCHQHHLECERTARSVEDARAAAGITRVLLPDDLEPDSSYDKWGNPILPGGARLRGPLFDEPAVQIALRDVLHLFQSHVKYPRTRHLPWSPGVSADDKVQTDLSFFRGKEVVITEKMDGENTTIYPDLVHARSLTYTPRKDRDHIKRVQARMASELPERMRVCGENLWAEHSIRYTALPSAFMGFSIWEDATCLSWDDTLVWFGLLGITPVPVLWRGTFQSLYFEEFVAEFAKRDLSAIEGYVVRDAGAFTRGQFPRAVLKWVRPHHVTTDEHWTRNIRPNGISF